MKRSTPSSSRAVLAATALSLLTFTGANSPARAAGKPADDGPAVTPAAAQPVLPITAHKHLKVAVFNGPGTSDSRNTVKKALSKDPNLEVGDISVEDIKAGKLSGFDLLVQPGGSGGGQGRALGEEGREQIRSFVKKGGGYLGICGGSYLATTDYPWSLGILNAQVVDKKHWARGHGPVLVAPTTEGKSLLGATADQLTIIYWQGPLLAPGHDATLPAYQTLAKFEGEIAKNGAPSGVMPGTTAVAAAPYGQGRVVCFSPHPEKTAGQEGLLHRAILWATRTGADSK